MSVWNADLVIGSQFSSDTTTHHTMRNATEANPMIGPLCFFKRRETRKRHKYAPTVNPTM
jgi:hypothetical protein